jgi:CopG family nickel-responsive transcriptional regulator
MMILIIIIPMDQRNPGRGKMERITITIDEDLLEEFDGLMAAKGYANRSEGIRDAVRLMLMQEKAGADDSADSVGCVVYMYNHKERALASRLVEAQHHHHDIPTATMHLHIDAENCLEATILRGKTGEVRHMADRITSQTGVKHGSLHLIPLEDGTG